MQHLGDVRVDPGRARVYEHGWQSWSPALAYRVGETPLRPGTEAARVMNWRPDTRPPADAFWGEGLLAVDPGDGSGIHVLAAPPGADPVPSIRADVRGDRVVLAADGAVEHAVDPGPDGLHGALGRWGQTHAARCGLGPLRPAPTLWCSWYHYSTDVTEADVEENLDALGELDLAVDVVQLDDGYQAEIGDWLVDSGRFGSLRETIGRIVDRGLRAGLWIAPFLVSPRSALAREHPQWLVPEATAGVNWGQELRVLDVTHPGAEAHLRTVFTTLRGMGVDFVKADFVYAGAVPGRRADRTASGQEAYRRGMAVVRESIGDAYLLGCGAPILPSVGLVDAMRISPDVAVHYSPTHGGAFGPSQWAATANGRGRAWQHGRLWVNDSDCLVVRPAVERRAEWAAHVERYGGLRASSDRLRNLDEWGLVTTRRLVRPVPAEPFVLDEAALG
ncbi:alpha-galactosidase [Geodermatophilus sp. TF02-6]|uniref:glycoside hydrolase family 36 protein n=1 Tax=Geodermatophilus sp. TF02-6 TaxID=2250575 RepID=UPI000DEA00E4|nr:glycoside hydrolase family 36 protein [Geodermatophilus sp. TF02-6]RBY82495.1 alpha-galactosidase [Geodermatophilus sp. TF02-6]